MINEDSVIVVPDIHGRSFWRVILDLPKELPVVFLGDYFDPYSFQGVTYDDAFVEFNKILEFAKSRDNVHLLIGNHDAHYLGLCFDTSRYSYEYAPKIYKLFEDNLNLFKLAWKWKDTIFTHAGICQGWLDSRELKPDNIVDFINDQLQISRDWIENPDPWYCGDSKKPIGDIGRSRGGFAPYGGPIWADVSDIMSLPYTKGYQVFGHTQLDEDGYFIHRDNWWMCDSRKVFIFNQKELTLYEPIRMGK